MAQHQAGHALHPQLGEVGLCGGGLGLRRKDGGWRSLGGGIRLPRSALPHTAVAFPGGSAALARPRPRGEAESEGASGRLVVLPEALGE